jgi:O-antigen ligase
VATAIALGVLVFAQSKTTWLCGLVTVAVVVWYKARAAGGRTQFALVFGLVSLLAIVTTYAALFDPIANWGLLAGADITNELTTLTGRVGIWDVAIEQWRENPLFGYGITIWDESFRRQIALPHAFSAHNQFLQSLSGAGLIGLAGLLTYLVVLFSQSHRRAPASRGITMAMYICIVFRCMTEVPFDISGIFSGEFICQLVLVQVLVARETVPVDAPVRSAVDIDLGFVNSMRRPPWYGQR